MEHYTVLAETVEDEEVEIEVFAVPDDGGETTEEEDASSARQWAEVESLLATNPGLIAYDPDDGSGRVLISRPGLTLGQPC